MKSSMSALQRRQASAWRDGLQNGRKSLPSGYVMKINTDNKERSQEIRHEKSSSQ